MGHCLHGSNFELLLSVKVIRKNGPESGVLAHLRTPQLLFLCVCVCVHYVNMQLI